jgi:hypothetical protein
MQHGLPIDAEIGRLSPVAALIEFSSVTSEPFGMQHRPTMHIKNRAFNLIATIRRRNSLVWRTHLAEPLACRPVAGLHSSTNFKRLSTVSTFLAGN